MVLIVLVVTLAIASLGQQPDFKAFLLDLRAQAAEISPFWMGGCIFLGSLFGVPVGVLMPLMALLLPPLPAAICLEFGLLLSGGVSFLLAKGLGAQRIQAQLGGKVSVFYGRLGDYGFWAVLTARLLPLAPFAVANLLLGTTPIRFQSFLLATALGLMPGIALTLIGTETLLRYL